MDGRPVGASLAWHPGSLMRSHTERRSEVFNHRHQFHMRIGAWRARDLPETALHVTSPCPTTQPLAGPPTCAVVWGREVLHGVVNHRRIDGKDGVAGSIPAGGSTPNQQARPGTTRGLLHARRAPNRHLPAIC